MNLKKNDQILLDQLQQFANTLFSMNQDFSLVKSQLKGNLEHFEQETGAKASLREENGEIIVSAFDLKKDDLRTTSNQDGTLVSMKAKSLGIALDVKVVRGGVKFTNGQVSESLREAADVIDRMQVQMFDNPASDWDRETGMPVKEKADQTEQGESTVDQAKQPVDQVTSPDDTDHLPPLGGVTVPLNSSESIERSNAVPQADSAEEFPLEPAPQDNAPGVASPVSQQADPGVQYP